MGPGIRGFAAGRFCQNTRTPVWRNQTSFCPKKQPQIG
jgi:hypothetical protein